jgi:hypothetical protein
MFLRVTADRSDPPTISVLSTHPPEEITRMSASALAKDSFVDRRGPTQPGGDPIFERRQFANSYDELSPEAAELARAIDGYKVQHRRRFITFEEMLGVIKSLGYNR